MTGVRHRPMVRAGIVALVLILQAGLMPTPAAADDVPTTISLSASASSSYRDERIRLTAVVTPNPGAGSVGFYDTTDGTCLCGFAIDPATGVASGSVRIWDLGVRQLQAVFPGGNGFAASESDLLPHEVLQRPSSITLDIGAINEIGEVDLTVAVTPFNVGGTVTISAASGEALISDAPVDVHDGVQTYTLGTPLVGIGPYTATYSGTLEYAPSSSDPVPWSDEGMPTTTTLEVTPGVGAPYDTWTWDVKVDPDDWGVGGPMDGVVRLYRPGQFAPWATLNVSGNGVARYTGQLTLPGEATYYAVYSGDEDYVTSRSADASVTAVRIPITTTVELSATTMVAGESVVATVTLDPPPSVFPPDPVVGLSVNAPGATGHFEAVPIDPVTGIGQATLSSDELSPELWTVQARFAQATPVSFRYEPSTSEPVILRYEPVGPRHTLSIAPSLLYPGIPT